MQRLRYRTLFGIPRGFEGQIEVQESILEKVEQILGYIILLKLRRGARVDEGGGLESR